MFIRQTRYCSGVLKLSWAALKYVWEILLPAATWQRNPRMESAAAPFQIGHLWWHEPLYHHRQLQPDLTTMCCQRFLRISNLGRRQHPTQQSLSLQSGKHPNLVGYISDIPKLRPYRIQPLVKGLQNFELYLKENRAMNQWTVVVSWEFMDCRSVMGVHLSKFTGDKKYHGCIFQACRLGESKAWKSNYVMYIEFSKKYHLLAFFLPKTLRM